ncbi:dolichol kinase EVAN-like isoform X1 [Telopea speciosissima]|uniref:dolichol kinase EVAN-like isoform X1 n=1 Tax=Telopea speciosissima TaxID=54955 RepID=UPI001CC7502B|nr:dolichol kinase EVAN-like isoform X1 [Telopea speciosissima]
MAVSAASLINGERAVVLLFISCLLCYTPLSLFFQGFALSLLAFAGFFVEISAENSTSVSRFRTRPGASSGILLGAVTLPAVMHSRLIQLSRAFSAHDIKIEEAADLNVQYWAVSSSCLGILVFLCSIIWHSTKNSSFPWCSVREAKFNLIFVLFYSALCSLSLASNSYSGLNVAVKLLWVFCHGLAAVRFIQHILHTFPSCASIGEALLVTSGLVFYFGDMFAYTLVKMDAYLTSSSLASARYGSRRSEISTIIQGMLVGLVVFPMFYKFVLRIWARLTGMVNSVACASEERTSQGIERSFIFYASLAVTLIVIVPAWIQYVQDFLVHPLLWYVSSLYSCWHS